jgi:hypothetical protein
MANENLGAAKKAKNDEFYTQYEDIEKEMNAYLDYDKNVFKNKTILLPCDDPEWSNFTKYFAQNFEKLGLKKLISTSYAPNSKNLDDLFAPTEYEIGSGKYDKSKSESNGRIFSLTKDTNKDKRIDFQDIEWDYLEGDGDFRSEELTALIDESDIVITNPPFSLFRPFLSWITEANKKFAVIGNKNAITYKEVFPLIKDNQMWIGATPMSIDLLFGVPKSAADLLLKSGKVGSSYRVIDGVVLGRASAIWLTNLEHGKRHQPLPLMTMQDNLRFSKHKEVKDVGYRTYDNYDAIEVPFTDSIPSDFKGVMGVPISYLDKYNPEQFEILGASDNGAVPDSLKLAHFKSHNEPYVNGSKLYKRIFIRFRKPAK